MQIKKLFKISLATLALGILAGCQTMPTETVGPTPTPTGQSISTVQITNTTTPEETASMTQEKMVKPFDGSVPQSDRDAFMKADAAKNPELCGSITVEAYKKFCVQQAGDKNSPPLQVMAPTQENCDTVKVDEQNKVKNCINYEE